MKVYALDRELPSLSALVEEVKHGEDIVLTDNDCPVARLLPAEESKPKIAPVAGSLKGFWMAPDFDEPLEDFCEETLRLRLHPGQKTESGAKREDFLKRLQRFTKQARKRDRGKEGSAGPFSREELYTERLAQTFVLPSTRTKN